MFSSLSVAQSGLYASRLAVDNVSNNLSNQNTEGYKKRQIELSELDHMGNAIAGRGVGVVGASRTISEYMYNNLIRETSKEGYFKQISNMIGGVEAVFKETDESGFSSDLDRYFQSVENLRSNPHSEIYKTDLRTQAVIVVETLKRLYTGIETQETYVKDTMSKDVSQINDILKNIGELNVLMRSQNGSNNDLLDKRDLLELKLSKFIDIEVARSPEYSLYIAGEIVLRYSENLRDVSTYIKDTSQVDNFVNNDKTSSNILNGIAFNNEDKIIFKLDNNHQVSVQFGETLTFDLNGDGIATTQAVDSDNYVRALAYKINDSEEMSKMVKANNGSTLLDANGKKITINTSDRFLSLEAKISGVNGKFLGRITVVEQTDSTDSSTISNRASISKNETASEEYSSFYGISIFDEPIQPNSGTLKAKIDNFNTDSVSNKFKTYKDKLDKFAQTLSDMTDKYIRIGTEKYIYGEIATDSVGTNSSNIRDIGLFSGSNVKNLTFNTLAVNSLSQTDLDYLSTMQWKKNIGFDKKAQDGTSIDSSSFSEFYQELQISISSDKENNDFLLETQKTVRHSIMKSYEQIVSVDNDEEMLDLIKFQTAYTSSAKIITVIDEMLNTLLGMKR